jgi:hypothetical protein
MTGNKPPQERCFDISVTLAARTDSGGEAFIVNMEEYCAVLYSAVHIFPIFLINPCYILCVFVFQWWYIFGIIVTTFQ